MSVGWDYKHQRRFMISKMGIGVYKCVYVHMYVSVCTHHEFREKLPAALSLRHTPSQPTGATHLSL